MAETNKRIATCQKGASINAGLNVTTSTRPRNGRASASAFMFFAQIRYNLP